jgi:hypothetical protein
MPENPRASEITWLEIKNLSANPTNVSGKYGIAIISGTLKQLINGVWSNVTGSGATAFTGLTDTPANYTGAGDKIVKVNTGATALEFVTPSGDVTMNASGVFAIASGVIVDDDINASAAIAYTKLDLTSAIVDSDISSSADIQISKLLAGGNDGDIIRRSGSTLVFVDPATLPGGTASGLVQSFTIEGGTYDITVSTTTQTSSAPTLTIPDFAGVSDTFVFTTLAQTLANKTLTSPVLTTPQINDTSADHQYIFGVNELTADRTITLPLLTGNDTFVFEAHAQTLTNKTLTSPILTTPQINDTSADHQYILAVNELTADRTITLPLLTGNDEFVFKDHAVTLTNKTIDADSNTISNINGDELDPVTIATAAYSIPIRVPVINTGSATVNIFNANAPFKFRVISATMYNSQAGNAGNWKLDDGTNDIMDTVPYGATDKARTDNDTIDDTYHEIAASGTLRLINSNAADTSFGYVEIMRVD